MNKRQTRFNSVRNFFPQGTFPDSNFPIQRIAESSRKKVINTEEKKRLRKIEASFFAVDKIKFARDQVRRSLKMIEMGINPTESAWDRV